MRRSRRRVLGPIAPEERELAEVFWETLQGRAGRGRRFAEAWGESGEDDEPWETTETVTVYSYNVQQSAKRVEYFVEKYGSDAHALCFQESGAKQFTKYKDKLDTYIASAGYKDPTTVVTVTSSRAAKAHDLKIDAGLNATRQAMVTKLRRNGLVVVNVHLTSGNPKRAKQELDVIRKKLVKDYEDDACLVIGDFNHTPEQKVGFMNFQGPPHRSGRALDWAMTRNTTGIKGVKLPNYGGSDHAPWGVTVEFKR